MSVQSEYPLLPVELHPCQDALGFYGSCRCCTTSNGLISMNLHNPRRKPSDQEYLKNIIGNNATAEHFSEAFMPYITLGQQQPQEQQPGRGSPEDSASYDCQQSAYDSEPSSSPSSVIGNSPAGTLRQGLSPNTIHHIPQLESITRNHHQHHPRRHQQSQAKELCDEMRLQYCSMHTPPPLLQQQQQQQRGPRPKRHAANSTNTPVTGNRKERRRTQSINTAFAELRDCIPHVPADTKLSKIKTLRLATSYIAYLTDMVTRDDDINSLADGLHVGVDYVGKVVDPPVFQGDRSMPVSMTKEAVKQEGVRNECDLTSIKRKRNRTGWPEHVWALELQH